MDGGRRQPHSLSAPRHRRIVDGLNIYTVVVEKRIGDGFAVHGVTNDDRNNVARILVDGQRKM